MGFYHLPTGVEFGVPTRGGFGVWQYLEITPNRVQFYNIACGVTQGSAMEHFEYEVIDGELVLHPNDGDAFMLSGGDVADGIRIRPGDSCHEVLMDLEEPSNYEPELILERGALCITQTCDEQSPEPEFVMEICPDTGQCPSGEAAGGG